MFGPRACKQGRTSTEEAAADDVLHDPLPPADAPRLEDWDCPRNWTWPEGPEQTLRCEARGNPQPSVHCARLDGGAVLALGLLGPVTRALAGTYRCTAVNIVGEAVKDVTLTVECKWGCSGPPGWVPACSSGFEPRTMES